MQQEHRANHYWGDGRFSSSDGQRFPVAVRTQNATPLITCPKRVWDVVEYASNSHEILLVW